MQVSNERDMSQLKRRPVGLPGADAKNVYTSAEFLDQLGRKRILKVKGDVLVIGNGSDALEAARAALRHGADAAVVVCMGPDKDMAFTLDEVAEAKAEGVRIVHGWSPVRIAGHADGGTTGASFKHCDRVFNDEGNFSPRHDEGNTMSQYGDTVVLAGE